MRQPRRRRKVRAPSNHDCICLRSASGAHFVSVCAFGAAQAMGRLTAAHLRPAALSCSRCEQLPKTLLADATRERRAPAFLARVARFGRVNSSIHTRGRPLSKSTRYMFSNLYAMPTDVWATKKNAPARGRFRSTICTSEVHFVLWGAQPPCTIHATIDAN